MHKKKATFLSVEILNLLPFIDFLILQHLKYDRKNVITKELFFCNSTFSVQCRRNFINITDTNTFYQHKKKIQVDQF